MTTTEYKEKLIKQFEQTASTLEQLRGAIAACNELIAQNDEEFTTKIEADESDA